jgi:hypothetical protein
MDGIIVTPSPSTEIVFSANTMLIVLVLSQT